MNPSLNTNLAALLLAFESGEQSATLLRLLETVDDIETAPGQPTLLHFAARQGLADVAAALIEKYNPDVNAFCAGSPHVPHNSTPLMAAVIEDENPVLPLLLKNGAQVNLQNEFGQTALSLAAFYGAPHNVRFLLEHGADPNLQLDETPLQLLLSRGMKPETVPEIAALLIEHGTNLNNVTVYGQFALLDAVRHGEKETVRLMLQAGADLCPPGGWNGSLLATLAAGGKRGATKQKQYHRFLSPESSLISAAQRDRELHEAEQDDVTLARFLIEQGLNTAPELHEAALHAAASNGHLELVRFLVDLGLNVNAPLPAIDDEPAGDPPLFQAIEEGRADVVVELLRRGADANARSHYHQSTPLMRVAHGGCTRLALTRNEEWIMLENALDYAVESDLKMVQALLAAGADLEAREQHGLAALHLAADAAAPSVVKTIIEANADIEAIGQGGWTPLFYCIAAGRRYAIFEETPQIWDWIEKERPVLRSPLQLHGTRLQIATDWDEAVLSLLLEAGAAVNVCDAQDITPLQWAAMQATPRAVQMLLQHGAAFTTHKNYGYSPIHFTLYCGRTNRLLRTEGLGVENFEGLDVELWNAAQSNPPAVENILPHAKPSLRCAAQEDIAVLSVLIAASE